MKKCAINISALLLFLFLAGAAHAGSTGISLSATVLSKSNCKFNTATSAINFGNLDPAIASNVTQTTAVTFRCGGSAPNATFFITTDNGLNPSGLGGKRMTGPVTAMYPAGAPLPYTLTLSPTTATVPKNVVQTLTLTGTVNGVDYINAPPGLYSDTVVISITP